MRSGFSQAGDPEEDDEDDRIPLNPEEDDHETDLGPDERDLDLMDGTWEQQYYSGRERTRDWGTIGKGLGLLVLISLLIPILAMVFR